MKKVSFLVAFLALLQAMSGMQPVQAQDHQRENDRPSNEEAANASQDDFENKLKHLFEKLDLPPNQIGESLERWAHENSDELQAWSEKYGPQWESWGARFEKKIAQLVDDQNDEWGHWAQQYDHDLNQWMSDIDSDELNPEQVGVLIERNLEMLSKMPLGQLIDQALHDGVGELKNAPWESLGKLAQLAQQSFQPPLHEHEAHDAPKPRGDLFQPDLIQKKIDREKLKHAELLHRFNDDLRQSNANAAKVNQKSQERESRKTKRPDGKNLDSSHPPIRNPGRRSARDKQPGRAPGNAQRATQQKSDNHAPANVSSEEEMLKLMRSELEKLRNELKQLKKIKSDR